MMKNSKFPKVALSMGLLLGAAGPIGFDPVVQAESGSNAMNVLADLSKEQREALDKLEANRTLRGLQLSREIDLKSEEDITVIVEFEQLPAKAEQIQMSLKGEEVSLEKAKKKVAALDLNKIEIQKSTGAIEISADAINGSDTITIIGNTSLRGSDVTLTVKSPMGNLITIAQVSPSTYGDFEIEIKTGGSMWKEDGMYTVTASQGNSSELKESIQVEIKDGVVVPEFGVIATLILAISIVSIIAVSSKTRLSVLPRY